MTFAKIKSFLAKLFVPFSKSASATEDALKAEIAKLRKEAEDKIAAVTANHSVDAIHARRASDLADMQEVFKRFNELVEADTTAKLDAASNVLPPINLPVAGSTGN